MLASLRQNIVVCAHAVMPQEIQLFAESMQVVMLARFLTGKAE